MKFMLSRGIQYQQHSRILIKIKNTSAILKFEAKLFTA